MLNRLPFILLSDRDGSVRKLYGATLLGFISGRVTYVIDKEGVVRHIFSSILAPLKHMQEALQTLGLSEASQK